MLTFVATEKIVSVIILDMYKQIKCIGGEQDGYFIKVREPKMEVKLKVYAKIDFRKLSGIVILDSQPIRTEIYHRKRFGDEEYFCLESLTEEEIMRKLPQ